MASAATLVAMILVVLSSLPAAHAGANFISRTCKRTQDAALCVALLNADPQSAYASSVHGLADIAAHTAWNNSGVVNFLGMRIDREGDPANVCLAAYLDAAKELNFDARDSFNEGDYVSASQLVASAQRAGDRCQDAFNEVDTSSTVTDMNRQMTERCIVARRLIDLLASSCCCCACSHKNF